MRGVFHFLFRCRRDGFLRWSARGNAVGSRDRRVGPRRNRRPFPYRLADLADMAAPKVGLINGATTRSAIAERLIAKVDNAKIQTQLRPFQSLPTNEHGIQPSCDWPAPMVHRRPLAGI